MLSILAKFWTCLWRSFQTDLMIGETTGYSMDFYGTDKLKNNCGEMTLMMLDMSDLTVTNTMKHWVLTSNTLLAK
jgi:hypothetical protein